MAFNATAMAEPTPKQGETFLLMQPVYQELLLSGSKTLEIRPCRLRSGVWFLGNRGSISGYVVIGEAAFKIGTDEQWQALANQHRVASETRMYAKTNCWANPVVAAARLSAPVTYVTHRGAIGFCKFETPLAAKRPADEDEALRPKRRALAIAG